MVEASDGGKKIRKHVIVVQVNEDGQVTVETDGERVVSGGPRMDVAGEAVIVRKGKPIRIVGSWGVLLTLLVAGALVVALFSAIAAAIVRCILP